MSYDLLSNKLGFDYQESSGDCGQRALIHALLLLGIPINKYQAHKFTDVPRWLANVRGTDDKQLIRGIRKAGCQAVSLHISGELKFRREVDKHLKKGIPLIVCAEEYQHWAVLAGKYDDEYYYWIDSSESELYGVSKWKDVEYWLRNDVEGYREYYAIGLIPREQGELKKSIVPNFRAVYTMFGDDEFAEYWGYYLQDLLGIFDTPARKRKVITAEEFFERYGKTIYENVCYFASEADVLSLKWEIRNYERVATAHHLTLSEEFAPGAISSLSAALTVIACNSM